MSGLFRTLVMSCVLIGTWLGTSKMPSLAPGVMLGPVSAQEPAGSPVDALETDVACDVTPRTQEELIALVQSGLATPHAGDLGNAFGTSPPPSGGRPADEKIVRAVSETMQKEVACINAGDFLRQSSLWTDDLVRRIYSSLGQNAQFSLGEITQHMAEAATPVPLPADQQAHLDSISDVLVYDDGRVGAVVQVSDTRSLVLFAKSGNRYLIDATYESPGDGTPAP